jgi:hypothetical protein
MVKQSHFNDHLAEVQGNDYGNTELRFLSASWTNLSQRFTLLGFWAIVVHMTASLRSYKTCINTENH